MNMNLKGIMQTLGAKPGQVVSNPYVRAFTPQVETIVKEEEDHEVSMANNSLDTIIKMATELKAKMGENEKDIPAWIQDHITNAENFISQASSNYHEYGTNEAGINGADRFPTLNAESVNEEVKDWDTIHNVFVKFLKMNTKELEKRVLSKDEDATKKAIKSIVSGLTNAQRNLKMESVNENLDNYSKDAITDMIINLSRYEGNEELIADLKKILKQRTLGKLKKEQSVNEGKFKKDDLVYNTRTKTVGIVRLGDDKYGEVKTDADGNVNVDELEKYNPIKHKHQQNAKVAPSTEKEVNNRGLFNPFKAESLRLKNIK
jgi:cell pole-organizing protein PopZ